MTVVPFLQGTIFRPLSAYFVVRILLGLVLLASSVLKGYQSIAAEFVGESFFASRTFTLLVASTEYLLALFLLANVFEKQVWGVALIAFLAFAGVSLWKAGAGMRSCGCFGLLTVSPWFIFVLDVLAVASLASWQPTKSPLRATSTGRVLGCITICWLALTIPGAWLVITSMAAETSSDSVAVIEPESFIGRDFPITGAIDISDRLDRGTWIVLFYRPGCSACEDAVSNFEELAKAFSVKKNVPRIALIDCSQLPTDAPRSARFSNCIYGRLARRKQWAIATPTSVLLEDGKVRHVLVDSRDPGIFRSIWN